MLNDFVRTPAIITETLLLHEKFEGNILEPCCGDGAISEVLKKHNYFSKRFIGNIFSSDKFDYGYGEIKNLFQIHKQYDNIITNPPFTHQQDVKKHLLRLTKKKLALLWYVKNLGNEIETKTSKHLKCIYILTKRIEWKEIKLGWLFGWYVWDKEYDGDIIIKRIKIKSLSLPSLFPTNE